MSVRSRHIAIAALACATLGAAGSAQAAGRVSVSVGRVEFAGLVIEDLGADFRPGGALALRAGRVRGIEATGPLSGFLLDCAALTVSGDTLACERGRLRGRFGSLGGQDTALTARRLPDGTLTMRFAALAIAGGRGDADVRIRGDRWHARANVRDADLAALAPVVRPWFELPQGFTVAGRASGEVTLDGSGETPGTIGLDLAIARLDFADAAGALAGEGVSGTLRATLTRQAGGAFATVGRAELAGGQAYADPVFLDFGRHAMAVDVAGPLAADASGFEAREFRVLHRGIGEVTGSAMLDLAGETLLRDARLRLAGIDLATAVPAYVQPFLIATAFKELEAIGRLDGEVDIAAGFPVRARLSLAGVALDSRNGALTMDGLEGSVNWYDDASRSALAGTVDDAVFQSKVSWQAASLWGIEFGAADLPFATTGRHFRLLEPRVLPIFDGGLAIGTLRVRHAGTPEMYVRFDAEIRPISVAPLARAFGWPEFSGKLSGSIPDLQLARGVVTLGGNLEAAVFDGRVVVKDLRLRDPLGQFPRLHASLGFDRLDLELLTDTFSFGMITGRMSGYVSDLETFAWMPESFDASFFTSPGDRSKHRISQRAVNNLSSIGGGSSGGVVAALQGGFLKFFESFGYDRLGLNCRLANDVCEMSGVERGSKGGYYIVKGKGIPRIDVIGSQSRVAWSTLVRQLGRMMESDIVVE